MRKSLLKQMTSEDVQEILDAGVQEQNAESILRYLRNENDVPPPIEERYPGVLACAEQVCGNKLTDSRERENILVRSFVAYKLHEIGYSYSEIGKMLKRDHSTVTNLVHRVRDMLSLPNAYKWEVQQFKSFEELCG